MFLVEEEPSRDGKEDDDADLAATSHEESEENFHSQWELVDRKTILGYKMVHKDHEHRDDAQQLDAGIPLPPPFAIRECAGAPCLAFMRLSFSASWFFLLTILL